MKNTQTNCHKGCLITLEGIDGCGKTLLATNLKKALEKQGYTVVHTREPGGTDLSEKVRNLILEDRVSIDPLAIVMLFLASRIQHVKEVIAPALQKNAVVLCERFHDSTIAYQGFAQDLGEKYLNKICDLVCPDIVQKTFLIDLDVKLALARRADRKEDRFETQDLAFHEKVRQGYLHLADAYPDRIVILDGSQSPDLLCSEALNQLQSCLFQVG